MKLIQQLIAAVVFTLLLNLPQASAAPVTHLNVPVKDFVTLNFWANTNNAAPYFDDLPGPVKNIPAGMALVVTDVSWWCKITTQADIGKLGAELRVLVNGTTELQTSTVPFRSVYHTGNWYSSGSNALTSGIVLGPDDKLDLAIPGCSKQIGAFINQAVTLENLSVVLKGYYVAY